MLPILRILPVGGVLLAILILVLALSPPDGSRPPLATAIAPARGALVDRERHPEWRQFLILAAVRRADELNRLRELPDTPMRSEVAPEAPSPSQSTPEAPQVAVVPTDQIDAEPDDTSPVSEAPAASLPLDIGEPPSTELPVAPPEEKRPQEVRKPEGSKPVRETRRRVAHRARHTRATANPRAPGSPNLLEILFGGQQYQQQYQQQQPYAAYANQPYGPQAYTAQQSEKPPPYRTDPPY